MQERPPWSRTTLKWHVFEQTEPSEWRLNLLPPYYAHLFSAQESDIMTHCRTGWRDAKTGRSRWAVFEGLDPAELERIQDFITDYEKYILLELNRYTENHFADELDSCLALDYNFDHDDPGARTEIGLLVYEAKYRRSIAAAEELARRIALALPRVPATDPDLPAMLSFVPASPYKRYDLPRLIVQSLLYHTSVLDRMVTHAPVTEPVLGRPKPPFKELTCTEKIGHWEKLLFEGTDLTEKVHDCAVYVIDDLYQSGATLWSYAKFLKSRGAAAVYGIVCEKSWGDKDNR